MNKNRIIGRLLLGFFVSCSILQVSLSTISCSKWTKAEALDHYKAPTQEYKNNILEYRKTPHKVLFGWFGNWTGKGGSSKQYELCGLPDSIDFVSLWLCLGRLTPEQQQDLADFNKRGSRTCYCYTPRNIGDFVTLPEGQTLEQFWGYKEGDEDSFIAASVKYANAIVDSCLKYNVNGFDIDLEGTGTLIDFGHPARLDTFMKVLREGLPREKGGLLVADIPAGWNSFYTILSDEVVKSLDYIVWQSYDIASSPSSLDNMFLKLKPLKPELWEEVVRKSILTATFERAGDKPRFKYLPYYKPSFGIDYAGIGAYHIEYDFPGNPDYAMLRRANSVQNPVVNE